MNSFLRALFLAEFLLLALPAILMLAALAVLLGGYSLFGALAAPIHALDTGSILGSFVVMAITLLVAAICLSGLFALWQFLTASLIYLGAGMAGLRPYRQRMRCGMAFAIPPLLITLCIGIAGLSAKGVGSPLLFFYLSGASLLLPTAHLWLASRAGQDNTATAR